MSKKTTFTQKKRDKSQKIYSSGQRTVWNELFHPVAIRLISKCDIVFRIGGPSNGAEMVSIGKEKGKRIIYNIDKIE